MYISLLGIFIHIVFLFSVFDIYFKSPIIHGMTPYSTPLPAPAKRLVLIVADGLRADKLFEVDKIGRSKAPFLRDIITNVGAWGISHTRVPTESRPGHVAIAAGIYEDVSAVAKGWKENPVNFDSVFNESRYSWAWGSPDILPMFAKGTSGNHVFIDTYSGEQEDFAGADPSHLDSWVFDKFEKFLESTKTNDTLAKMLAQDQIIIFLHLLGLDTSGHAYKPGSQEYINNIQIVDSGVEKCMNLIEDYFYHDEQTSYIFTSDHGMTDWGSHGAGHPHETYTPLVAWGAGIRGPLGEGKDYYYDGLSEVWKLSQVKRVDVNQADIAPLIAALIGIPFPVNSVGMLPVEYLGSDWPHRAMSLLTNARQVLAHYQLKMKMKKETTLPIFFWNYRDLAASRQAELMSMIETLLKQYRYRDAIQVGLKLIELALKGIVYYQKYDRFVLNLSIFLGFLGWMSYVVVLILRDYTTVGHSSLESSVMPSSSNTSKMKVLLVFGLISSMISSLLYVQYAPVMYYAYFLLPVFLWALVALRIDLFQHAKVYIERRNYVLQFAVIGVVGFVALEILVMTFFKRELLSLGLWGIAIWPLFTPLKSTHKMLTGLWFLTSLGMSVFPLLPVVGRTSNYNLVVLAGWLSVFGIAFCARRPETGLILNNRQSKKEPEQVIFITAVQVVILCVATYTVRSTAYSISNKEGLPLFNQIISWLILASSLVLPLFGSTSLLTRLLNVMTSLLAPYLLMCISHEGLFCLFLCILMFLWLCVEHHLSDAYTRDMSFDTSPTHLQRKCTLHRLSFEDLRRAYCFIFFILVAFFGTGNIASLNSFEPSSVYCFLTVFSPFVMGFLILLKVTIPFLIVSCALRAIVVTLKASPRALFLLILLMSDFLGLHFFFLVQDNGSWLEIGTSISHYVINMTMIIFIMLLYGLAWILTSYTLTLGSLKRKRHVQ